jgi:hypothetical protein
MRRISILIAFYRSTENLHKTDKLKLLHLTESAIQSLRTQTTFELKSVI